MCNHMYCVNAHKVFDEMLYWNSLWFFRKKMWDFEVAK